MSNRAVVLVILAVAWVVAGLPSVATANNQRRVPMDTTGWKTHCFGRFLVDLPPQAQVRAGYSVGGLRLERLRGGRAMVMREIEVRENALKQQPHRTQGSMFIKRETLGGEGVGVLSWRSDSSLDFMFRDAYFFSRDGLVSYKYSGLLRRDREDRSRVFVNNLSNNVHGLRGDETPVGPGFCVDGGYIAGNVFMAERFRVGFTMPEHPGMHFSIMSSTGAAETTLLERVGGFFRTEVVGWAAGMRTLRKRRRALGPYQGEEYLVTASKDGQTVYAFIWEYQGKNGSLSEPNLVLDLGVLERDTDDEGTPPPPAFQSDREALQLWDAILNSIRLRPGAV